MRGVIIDLPVTTDRVNYIQSVELNRPGACRIRVDCGGTTLRSEPVITVPPPQECQAAALVSVRGQGDNLHDGYDYDYPGAHALDIAKNLETNRGIYLYDADGRQDRAIGLNYPAVSIWPEGVQYSAADRP